MSNSHLNNGACDHCREIIEKFPGFEQRLQGWFHLIQAKFHNFHIAEAGRGKIIQEVYFNKGASRAHWTQSAHNWNAAIDTFWLVDGAYSLENSLYAQIQTEIPDFIEWYGARDAIFYERPHFEIKNWAELALQDLLKLVE